MNNDGRVKIRKIRLLVSVWLHTVKDESHAFTGVPKAL